MLSTPFGHEFLCMILPDLAWADDGTWVLPTDGVEAGPLPASEEAIAEVPRLDLDRDHIPSSVKNPTGCPICLESFGETLPPPMYDRNGNQVDEDGDVLMGGVDDSIDDSTMTTTEGPSPDPERQVALLPCNHLFHDGCVSEWLHTNHTCPLCRYELNAVEPVLDEDSEDGPGLAGLLFEEFADAEDRSVVEMVMQFWNDFGTPAASLA